MGINEFIQAMANKALAKPIRYDVTIAHPANNTDIIHTSYDPLVWDKIKRVYNKEFDVIQTKAIYQE